VNKPSLQPSPGVPPNWKHVPCISRSLNLKARVFMIEENTLLQSEEPIVDLVNFILTIDMTNMFFVKI